jgi:hypothetical protein
MLVTQSNDILGHIKTFLGSSIFNLRSVSKRFLVCEKNPNIIKVSLEAYILVKHHSNLKFELDLSSTKVVDVSVLGNVHTLDLSSTKVVDVSALGNVHKLNL